MTVLNQTAAEIREMDSRIERVVDDVYHGRPEGGAQAPIDPRDVSAHELDTLKGRHEDKDGHWRQVMEHYGFSWFEPKQLDELIGPRKIIPSQLSPLAGEKLWDKYGRPIPNARLYWTQNHTEGQWRSDAGKRLDRCPTALRGLAFTMKDLAGSFESPEKFDQWAKQVVVRRRKQRQRRIDLKNATR